MKNLIRVAAMALLGSVAATSTAWAQRPAPPGNPTPCNPGTCTFTITVKGDCKQPGSISIDKPFVSTSASVNMRWTVATPGHELTTDDIRFDPSVSQFVVKNSLKPNEFHIHNKKSKDGDFYWFVNLKGCAPPDPSIRNKT